MTGHQTRAQTVDMSTHVNYVSEGSLRKRPQFVSDSSLYERLDALHAQFKQHDNNDALLRRAIGAAKERLDENEDAYNDLVRENNVTSQDSLVTFLPLD